MHMPPTFPPVPSCLARSAASACLAALAATPGLPPLLASPRRALGAMVSSLQQGAESADTIRIVRASVPKKQGDAWDVPACASAWPLRYGAEIPLLYLCRLESLAALRGVLVDAGERGIVCNDAETQGSRWPKGVQPVLPAWLATQHICTPFDPASGEEVRAIVCSALATLYVDQQPGYYYLAMHDEDGLAMPPLSAGDAAAAALGMYRLPPTSPGPYQLRLCSAGRALALVMEAARLLWEDWNISAEVWSCPSYTRLAREALAVEQWNLFHPSATPRASHIQRCLDGSSAPVIAVTGYAQHIAGQIGGFVRGRFSAVGADTAMDISAPWIAVTALKALVDDGALPAPFVQYALRRYALA
ncbi:transketolase-like TK C-terminal-containing protein [Massilia aquatica]|uniref:Pyruvate dehydrogenase n=1 Tax=Massilia aquatica TaxID=2609000 RepID=A0ABX0MB66_9BURK|nr:pyruvate dehydrogenase [Massilia aquatica]NHZ44413.1 pyruvate dehydrogenase [Massilia aquatica]